MIRRRLILALRRRRADPKVGERLLVPETHAIWAGRYDWKMS